VVPHRRHGGLRHHVAGEANSTSAAITQPQFSTKIDAVSALANVYLDLGTWAGFTPYIGGGGGMSYLRSKNM